MHDDLGHHTSQKVAKQAEGELPVGPVMSILHDLQGVALEVDFAIKVHLVKGFHWYLILAIISRPVILVVEFEVMFDRTTGVPCLLVFPG